MHEKTGAKEDCFWAIVTAFGCAVATKLGELLVEEAQKRLEERRKQAAEETSAPANAKPRRMHDVR